MGPCTLRYIYVFLCLGAYIRTYVRACVCACVRVCVRACVPACPRACLPACLPVCLPACVCACVRGCMSPCVHACVRVIVCVLCCVPACRASLACANLSLLVSFCPPRFPAPSPLVSFVVSLDAMYFCIHLFLRRCNLPGERARADHRARGADGWQS